MTEQKLRFADVAVGDSAPVLTHELSRTDLVRYAGASQDFNPMHHDEIAAQAVGLPSVFGHGMFSMGLVGRALTDFVGVGNLTRFGVRFTKQTWPDEELTTAIRVTAVRPDDSGDGGEIDMECELANGDGEVKVSGSASARLA